MLGTCSISKCEKVKFTLFPIGALILQVQFLNSNCNDFSLDPFIFCHSLSSGFVWFCDTPVMRVESGEVGTLNDTGKPCHFCVAKSAVSDVEPSTRHTEVRPKPGRVLLSRIAVKANLIGHLTLTIFPSDSTIVPESES